MHAAIAHRTVRGTHPTSFLWTLAVVALVYLLLAVPCTHGPQFPVVGGHDTLEIVHLPRGTSGIDGHAAQAGQDLRPSQPATVQSAGPTPKSGDPAPAALACALGLALLALLAPVASIPACLRTAEAVLGVGRWHRAVVLLL